MDSTTTETEKRTFKTAEAVLEYVNSEEVRSRAPFASRATEVKPLSGGLCNYVYRLFFEDGSTAVFKYYPPLVTSADSLSIYQERQQVEKRALEILGSEKRLLEGDRVVRTPKLLYSDDQLYLIIMQDCGQDLVTLFDFLRADYRPPASAVPEDTAEAREAFVRRTIDLLAKKLREFLRIIATETSIKPQTHREPFSNPYAWQILNRYYFALDDAYAKKLDLEKELAYYIKNQRRFVEPPADESCFVLGDLWPNAVLINPQEQIFWALDWEVSRFETPLRDLEQLHANLWVMKQNGRLFNVDRIEYLIRRLQFEYFGDEAADLRVKCGDYAKINFVLWVIWLLRVPHWEIEDTRACIIKAINEVEQL